VKSYKGYIATIWLEPDDRLFHGLVDNLRDTIHFAGASVEELETAFHDSVDVYLDWCAKKGRPPEKPYSGKLAFRTTPEHHRMISEAASKRAKSINQWMDEVLAKEAAEIIAESRRNIRAG
jgi:predicted HicB family RNase H-like nuclease